LDADRHGLPVALDDDFVGDAGIDETLGQLVEVSPIACCKSDGDGSRRNWTADALAGGVDGLRDLRPVREVGADDDVVREVCGGVPVAVLRGGPDVNGGCAWSRR
jgi:hypothetical protein